MYDDDDDDNLDVNVRIDENIFFYFSKLKAFCIRSCVDFFPLDFNLVKAQIIDN